MSQIPDIHVEKPGHLLRRRLVPIITRPSPGQVCYSGIADHARWLAEVYCASFVAASVFLA